MDEKVRLILHRPAVQVKRKERYGVSGCVAFLLTGGITLGSHERGGEMLDARNGG